VDGGLEIWGVIASAAKTAGMKSRKFYIDTIETFLGFVLTIGY